jgi:hypothetical protein
MLAYVAAPLITVQAGLLTPFVWLFANLFYRYRYRQSRWRGLVASRFAALA